MKKRDRLRPSKTLVDRKRHDRAPILIDLTIDSDDDMKSEVEVQELLAMSPVPEVSSSPSHPDQTKVYSAGIFTRRDSTKGRTWRTRNGPQVVQVTERADSSGYRCLSSKAV